MSATKHVPLGDIAALQAGVGFPLELQGRSRGRYPVAKVGDISRVGRSGESVLSAADHYVEEADLERLRTKPIPAGSVLFAKIGEAIRHNHRVVAGCELLVDNNAMAAIPTSKIQSRFLYHFLRTLDFYELASATTVPALRKSDLETIEVPLPPLSEQRRISNILDKADALRAKRRAAIAQLDTLTQSIFLDLFGDPVTNPREWRISRFADVLADSLRNGLSPSSGGNFNARVLTLSAITGSQFDKTAWKLGTFTEPPPLAQSVNRDYFLMCRGNGNLRLVGRGYFPDSSMENVTFPDTMIAARIREEVVERSFLQHLWHSFAVRWQIESFARTTNGTFKVNQTMLGDIKFILPPISIQSEFARRAGVVDTVRTKWQESLTHLEQLFSSLQNDLLAQRG